MVWGAEITFEIMQAAIRELYKLPSFNAIHALRFYKKYGVHFQTKEEIKLEAHKRGFRFLGTPPIKAYNKKYIEAKLINENTVYDDYKK